MTARRKLSGWGRFPWRECNLVRPVKVRPDPIPRGSTAIGRGLGRSYGDAALNGDGVVLLTERLDRFLSFDAAKGVLRAEAGVTIRDLLRVMVPRGWFPAVVPGTQEVTLGGCVAADVHGKNHHRVGSFGRHVRALKLLIADGSILECSRDRNAELFLATIGGMGLTGLVIEVEVELQRIESRRVMAGTRVFRGVEGLLSFFSGEIDDEYTIGWVDLASQRGFGAGIGSFGHHVSSEERTDSSRRWDLRFPLPCGLLGSVGVLRPWGIRAFNRCYALVRARRREPRKVPMAPFFFPLDSIAGWNRLYGRSGFLQYQFVLPSSSSRDGLREVWTQVRKKGVVPYLTTVKRFGPKGEGYLSFPIEGYTVALDFPVGRGEIFPFLERLDALVAEAGGRIYLAKDARAKGETIQQMYGEGWERWRKVKERVDPHGRFSSDLSRRLGLHGRPF